MTKPFDKLEARIELQQKKLTQLKEQKARLETVKKVRDAKVERAADTRRKILLGAYLLEEIQRDSAFEGRIKMQLAGWLKREDDRKLFSLPPLAAE